MLEKPDLQDEEIIACLQTEYGLRVAEVAFLPLGADLDTAVYRVIADDESSYFVKLRSGVFDKTSVALPKFLSDQGIAQIITPLTSQTGQLWVGLDTFKMIVYPFIEGHNGFEFDLSDRQWKEFGAALKRIHTSVVPPALINRIRQETYSHHWRNVVKTFMKRVEDEIFHEPVAVELAAYLTSKRCEILDLVRRAERLALALQSSISGTRLVSL